MKKRNEKGGREGKGGGAGNKSKYTPLLIKEAQEPQGGKQIKAKEEAKERNGEIGFQSLPTYTTATKSKQQIKGVLYITPTRLKGREEWRELLCATQ